MVGNPYSDQPARAFWRSAVGQVRGEPDASYFNPKWQISQTDSIATAGSCFAQHVGRELKKLGFNVLDVEPSPNLLPAKMRPIHGYELYSGRYGNIYTARQLLQLTSEALGIIPPSHEVWEKDGKFVDALRPTIDPEGHESSQTVLHHRRFHLQRIRSLFTSADLFVFTLGLTESWVDSETGRVYPVCPGTVAGEFSSERHMFKNFTVAEVYHDLLEFRDLLLRYNKSSNLRILLTVSPVPLTATASDKHVAVATTFSKSVLRAAAGQFANEFDNVDYFPSYEMITSPWSAECRYADNLRSVRADAVEMVMRNFAASYAAHRTANLVLKAADAVTPVKSLEKDIAVEDEKMKIVCDEELLETFGIGRS